MEISTKFQPGDTVWVMHDNKDEFAVGWSVFLASASSIFLMSRQWPIDDEYLRNSAAGMIHRSAIVLISLSVIWVLMLGFGV